MIKTRITGWDTINILDSLEGVFKENSEGIKETVNKYAVALHALKLSNIYAPKDTGFMVSTGKIYSKGDKYIIKYSAPYAGYVHEIIGNVHKPGETAKFLEIAFLEVCNDYRVTFDYRIRAWDSGLSLTF